MDQPVKVAVEALKWSLKLLEALNSDAAAAISMKLIDAIESMNMNNYKAAAADLWACSFAIQRIIYEALSEKLSKKSAIVGQAVPEALNLGLVQKAHDHYFSANVEITKNTGYEVLFIRNAK